jgi:hypothetical protein
MFLRGRHVMSVLGFKVVESQHLFSVAASHACSIIASIVGQLFIQCQVGKTIDHF